MLRKIIFGMCCVAACSLSGCATIIHGSSQQVGIVTNPPGAKLLVDGQELTSPASVTLNGKAGGYVVTATKPGYQPTTAKIDSTLRAGSTIIGNLFWLLPGLIVDFGTGSAYELQDHVMVSLNKA